MPENHKTDKPWNINNFYDSKHDNATSFVSKSRWLGKVSVISLSKELERDVRQQTTVN